MIPIVVDSRFRFDASSISDYCFEELTATFTHSNPAFEDWKILPPRTKSRTERPNESIETWRWDSEKTVSFPRGGSQRIREIFRAHGYVPNFEDRRSSGTLEAYPNLRERLQITPYDFQEEMVSGAISTENCILRAPCGSGKTEVGITLTSRVGVSTLVVVPTSKIFDEWVSRFGSSLGLSDDEIGRFGRGKKKIRPITVSTVDTLKRHVDEVKDLFGCVIFDELQRCPAATYFPAIDALPCRYRIGISADERRKDGKHPIAHDLFGKIAVDVPRQELVSRGIVIAADIVMIPTEFEAPWYVELDDSSKRQKWVYTKLLGEMVTDPDRTKIAVAAAVGSALLCPTLVFSHRVEHCARMRSDILAKLGIFASDFDVGVVLGGTEFEEESKRTVLGLKSGTVRCGVGTYQSVGTGVDVPRIEAGIAVTPIHANKQNFGQIRDRLCRVDRRPDATKKSATLFVLWDRKVFGTRPLRNMIAWNGLDRVKVLENGEPVDASEYI